MGGKNKKDTMKGKKDNNIDSLLLFLTKMLELTPPTGNLTFNYAGSCI